MAVEHNTLRCEMGDQDKEWVAREKDHYVEITGELHQYRRRGFLDVRLTLEASCDGTEASLCAQEVVVDVGEILVLEMVPSADKDSSVIPSAIRRERHVRARVTVEHRWGLEELLAVLAPLALEEIVRLHPLLVSPALSIHDDQTHLA